MFHEDWLYNATNHVLVSDSVVADLCRLTVAIVCVLVTALLARMYLHHQVGRMNSFAAWGAIMIYLGVSYAQVIALSNPDSPSDLTVLNIFVLSGAIVSLVGVLKSMRITLFRRGS